MLHLQRSSSPEFLQLSVPEVVSPSGEKMSTEYEVTIFVEGYVSSWSLYKSLNITLVGTKDKSEPTSYSNWNLPFFRRNEIKFTVKCSDDLGSLVNIKLDKYWSFPFQNPWYHEKVVVESQMGTVYTFPIHQSISEDKEHFFREGKAMLPQKETITEVISLRQEELKNQKEIYGWKEYKPGMPHCLKADSLPLDEIYSLYKGMELLITKTYGELKLIWTTLFKHKDQLKTLHQVEDLHKNLNTKPSEYVMQNWKEDSFFGSQFLNGLNPMMIRRIKSLPEKFPVKNHMVFPDVDDTLGSETERVFWEIRRRGLLNRRWPTPFLDGNDTLESEMEKGNIFLCDYSILDGVETNTINGKQQYLTAPLVLLHKNRKDEMMPIAIQLKQEPGEDNPIFLPSDSKWDWLLAKLYVRSADFNLHELNSHLLRTHLLAEVFAVALKRNLSRVHPVFKILIRHTHDTLQINVLARQRLISDGGVFAKFTASGGKGTDTILQRSLSNLTYTSLCIPDDIKERGLEDVKNFHYRDDGLKLWGIMHSFVKDTLSYYYKEDSDVKNDKELQDWIWEIFEHGFLGKTGTGIPQNFKTKQELFKFVTMVMFTCSAQHAAVNSGQFDFYGWMPNGPSTMREPPPTKKNTVKEATILKTLPDIETIVKGMATVWVLSTQASDSILLPDFKRKYFTENILCDKIRIFQKNLRKLSKEIQKRNEGLDLPYTYLDPEKVETSVSI